MSVEESVIRFASSGRSSPNRPQFAPRPRCDRTWRWWSGPQTCVPARLGSAALIGPNVGARPHFAPAHEPALLVRLVELERLDRAAELALPALEVLVEQAADVRERDASSAASRRARTSSRARPGARPRPRAAAAASSRWRSRPARRPSRARSARRRHGRPRSRPSRARRRSSRAGGRGRQ